MVSGDTSCHDARSLERSSTKGLESISSHGEGNLEMVSGDTSRHDTRSLERSSPQRQSQVGNQNWGATRGKRVGVLCRSEGDLEATTNTLRALGQVGNQSKENNDNPEQSIDKEPIKNSDNQ